MRGGFTMLPSILRTTVWHHKTIQITSDSVQVEARQSPCMFSESNSLF